MIRIAAVDNDPDDLKQLCEQLLYTAAELEQQYKIDSFLSGKDLLDVNFNQYDLICLDIDMPERDGLGIASDIRRINNDILIMFVTNMAQMAIRGYDVQAVDFILKPVNRYALLLKMQRIVKLLRQNRNTFLRFQTENGFKKVSSADIYYIEVNGHYLFYHTKFGIYRQKEALKQVEKILAPFNFRRCNNCYLVNLQHVNALNCDDVQVGTEWLKISRARKKQFLEDLTNYMEGCCGK